MSLSGAAFVLLLGTGAVIDHSQTPAQTAAAAPPPVTVASRIVNPKDVRVWSEFSGRLTAVNAAEIRPEVSGRITEIRFADGQTVKAGDVLFVIDPRTYEAAADRASANLNSARATAAMASAEFSRAASLLKTQFVSRSLYDQRASASNVALANVRAAEAALNQARIDVDHAYVKAPITGRISRAEITLGNLVQTGPGAPVLASIISNDGIYADFEVDEQSYLQSRRTRSSTQEGEQEIPVELVAQGDAGVTYKGTLYSFDNKIDTRSGTIRARARFDNSDGTLIPGMFVSVRLGSSVTANALLVPDRAIGSDQSKKFVYVVDQNKANYREVKVGQEVGGERIILTGLHAGDRVVVDGVQQLSPGAAVQIENAAADAPHDQRAALSAN